MDLTHETPTAWYQHGRLWFCAAICAVGLTLSAIQATKAPITYDEAYTYLHFATKPVSQIFRDYHVPNNHILHSLMVRSVTLGFGNSEIAIRVPALIGGGILLLSVVIMAQRFPVQIGVTWVALVALTPMVLEYNAMARGYSLGCGLSLSALAILTAFVSCDMGNNRDPTSPVRPSSTRSKFAKGPSSRRIAGKKGKRRSRRAKKRNTDRVDGRQLPMSRRDVARLITSGVLFGLAIACVPTFCVIVAAALAAFFLVLAWPVSHVSLIRAFTRVAILVVGVVPVVAFFYLDIEVQRTKWAAGFDNVADVLRAFLMATFNIPVGYVAYSHAWIVFGLIVLLILMGLAAAMKRVDRSAALILITLALSMMVTCVLRFVMDIQWPPTRTLLYLTPLALFALIYAPFTWLGRFPHTVVGVACVMVLVWSLTPLCLFDPMIHYMGRKTASVREAMAVIDEQLDSDQPVIVSIPIRIATCVRYSLLRDPRRRWEFQIRPGWHSHTAPEDFTDFAIGWSADVAEGWQWPGQIVWEDSRSGLVVVRRETEL